jgi:Bacterial Ig domain
MADAARPRDLPQPGFRGVGEVDVRRYGKSWAKVVVAGCIALGVFGAGAATAAAAVTLSVGLAGGAGNVIGPGINCSRDASAKVSGTCTSAGFADPYDECDDSKPPKCHTVSDTALLTANDVGASYAFDHWEGDCARAGRQRDCGLNMTAARTATAVYRDLEPPTATLTAPTGAVHGTIDLSATPSDNVGVTGVDFFVRGAVLRSVTSPGPYRSSFDTTTAGDGAATIFARATDTSGNHGDSQPVNVVIDNTPPTVAVSGPSGDSFAGASTQTWDLAPGDATSGVAKMECSVVPTGEAPDFGACKVDTPAKRQHSVSGLPQGHYVFAVRVFDGAGNTVEATRNLVIDTTPPVTTITAGIPDGAVTGATSQTWTFATNEPGSTLQCRVYPAALTPGPFGPCSGVGSHTATGFASGSYTFEVLATDAVGNAASVKTTFAVDTVAPDTTVSAGPDGPTSEPSPSFSFSSADASATFECGLDGGTFSACASPVTYQQLADGAHTFAVRARDGVGNADDSPATRAFTITRPRPAVPPAAGGGNVTPSGGTRAAPQRMFVPLKYDYDVHSSRTKLVSAALAHVPAGVTVKVSCKGGCPARVASKTTNVKRTVKLKTLAGRWFKAGAVVSVIISKPGFSSVTKTLKIRAGKRPVLTST